MMRNVLLSTAAVVALSTGALAADLPTHAPPPPFVPPPAFTWAGVYLGATLGYAETFNNFQQYSDPYGFTGEGYGGGNLTGQHQIGGVAGGPEIGINFQNGSFVYGLEADVNFTGVKQSNSRSYAYPYYDPGYTDTFSASSYDHLSYIGTVRGRIGLAVDRTLIYFTAGVAYANFHNSRSYGEIYGYSSTEGGYYDNYNSVYSSSNTKVGWVVGGGVEYAITPNWIIKGEALYAGLGNSTVPVQASYLTSGTSSIYVDRSSGVFNNNVLLIRAGVDYKFDWFAPAPAPLVAKY